MNLEKAAWTADGRWVKVLAHPKSSSLDSVEDVNGKMMNPVFRKDLNDPKTNRPCRREVSRLMWLGSKIAHLKKLLTVPGEWKLKITASASHASMIQHQASFRGNITMLCKETSS